MADSIAEKFAQFAVRGREPMTFSDTPGGGRVTNWREEMRNRMDPRSNQGITGGPVMRRDDYPAPQFQQGIQRLREVDPELARKMLGFDLDRELNGAVSESQFWKHRWIGGSRT